MLLGSKVDAIRRVVVVAVALASMTGCSVHLHHKVRPLMLPPFTPVELAQIPEPSDPPIIEAEDDEDDLPPVPVAEGASVPKRQRRRVVKAPAPIVAPAAETAPPPQVATAASPGLAETAIGELTPGGDQDPKTIRDATELIAANDKRLKGLSGETLRSQAALVSNVRNFQNQAQQALRGGDAGGAQTLATKAKLLLDDLEKGGGG